MKRFNALTASTSTVAADSAATKPARRKTASEAAPDFRRAAVLLRSYTGHSGDFWRLAGPSHADERVQIMSALLGKRVPKKAAGLTAIRDLFYEHIGASRWDYTCTADQQAKFTAWLTAFVEGKAPETNVPTPTPAPMRPIALTPAPVRSTAAAPVRYHNAAAASNDALPAAVRRLPLATFAFLRDEAAMQGTPESIRDRFAEWCEGVPASDWRKAWQAFVSTTATAPANVVPFTPAAEAEEDAESGGTGDAETETAAVDPIEAALAAFV